MQNLYALGDRDLHCHLVEKDSAQAERAAAALSARAGQVLRGDALDENFLRSEGLEESDLVISVTDSDEINLLSGILAKRLGVARALAVISSPTLDNLSASLGLDGVLNPRELVFSSVLRHLRRGRILFLYALPHGGGEVFVAELLERGSSLLGRPLPRFGLAPCPASGGGHPRGAVHHPTGKHRVGAGRYPDFLCSPSPQTGGVVALGTIRFCVNRGAQNVGGFLAQWAVAGTPPSLGFGR